MSFAKKEIEKRREEVRADMKKLPEGISESDVKLIIEELKRKGKLKG